jgi:hypothetical protein
MSAGDNKDPVVAAIDGLRADLATRHGENISRHTVTNANATNPLTVRMFGENLMRL